MSATTTTPVSQRRAASDPSRVVVATDFSNRAWSVTSLARQVAGAWDIPVEFAHVDTASPWVASSAPSRLSLRTSNNGRLVDTDVVAGPDVAAALDQVRRSQPGSLLALGTHGHVALSKLTFGSVCEQLVTDYDAPVLAVGPMYARAPGIERVVVCIAPADVHTSLAADAARWALQLGCPLTVLGIDTRHQSESVWPLLTRIADDAVRRGAQASALVVDSGNAAAAIVDQAGAAEGTLLVMAPRSHSLSERLLLGSVTLHVLRHTPSGVLLLPHEELLLDPATVEVRSHRRLRSAAPQPAMTAEACHDDYPPWPQPAAAPSIPLRAAGCHDDYSDWE